MLGATKQIKGRSHTKIVCNNCLSLFWKRTSLLKYSTKHFCNRKCQAQANKTGLKVNCAECGHQVYRSRAQLQISQSGRSFCNRSCATSFNNRKYKTGKNHPSYIDGSGSYRNRALRHYEHQCSSPECPFEEVEPKMLDVDHIDNNRANNKLENLQVLCVWCHALKTRKAW